MRRVAVVAAAALAACSGSSPQVAQHPHADFTKVMPADFDPGTKHEGEVKVAKVRAYADADYRAKTPKWKDRITDELDYANSLLTPMLGVRLELTDVVEWDHSAPDAPLRESLAALEQAAPADDVAWVIGFTSPPADPTNAFDELGAGELFGRHIVLRGYDDDAQTAAFHKQYPDVPIKYAGDALDARRRHKQTCLLLHQLGHTLGAIHETDPSWIIHVTYDPQQATISERNRELMQIALADRLKISEMRDKVATASQLLAAIEKNDWGGWVAGEKDDETNTLRAIVDAAKKARPRPTSPPPSTISTRTPSA